jgi:hypothetical protein
MDQQKLRNLVFEKTGVKIDVDDPVFALVALNEAVLAEAVERHTALLREATGELAAQVALLQGGAAAPGTQPNRASASASTADPASPGRADRRTAAIALASAVLGGVLVLGGQALFASPAAAPAAEPAVSAAPAGSAAETGKP